MTVVIMIGRKVIKKKNYSIMGAPVANNHPVDVSELYVTAIM